MMRKLTPRQQRFVAEYLCDLNATQAAIRSGYSAKTAEWIGPQLLTKIHVAEVVQAAMDERARRTGITQDRVLQEYARLAFYDPRKFFDEDGSLIPLADLDDDTARAVVSFDVVRMGNDKAGDGELAKVRMADKLAALNSVARHLGMLNDKLTVDLRDGRADSASTDEDEEKWQRQP